MLVGTDPAAVADFKYSETYYTVSMMFRNFAIKMMDQIKFENMEYTFFF